MAQPVVVMAPVQQPLFDETDYRWRCCCGCCHVKTGTLILGIIEAIYVVLQLLSSFGVGGSAVGGSLLGTLIIIAVLVCLFLGLKYEKAVLLIPHLVVQVIGLIILGIMFVAILILLATGNLEQLSKNYSSRQVDVTWTTVGIGILIFIALAFAIEVWFMTIVCGCYRYFKAKQESMLAYPYGSSQMAAQFSSGAVVPQPVLQQPTAPPPQQAYGFKS